MNLRSFHRRPGQLAILSALAPAGPDGCTIRLVLGEDVLTEEIDFVA